MSLSQNYRSTFYQTFSILKDSKTVGRDHRSFCVLGSKKFYSIITQTKKLVYDRTGLSTDLPSHRAPLSLNTSLESNCFDTRSSRRRPLGSSRRPFFFSGLRIPCRVISEYLWTRLDHFSLNRLLLFVWYTAATQRTSVRNAMLLF